MRGVHSPLQNGNVRRGDRVVSVGDANDEYDAKRDVVRDIKYISSGLGAEFVIIFVIRRKSTSGDKSQNDAQQPVVRNMTFVSFAVKSLR